jgi:uncharacterized membrane protein
MPKEIPIQDLLSKLSANSFLVDTTTQRFQVTPGIFLNMPGKFFSYTDVLDTALKIMTVNQEGKTVVDLDQFVQQLTPKALDLNQYFKELEKTIKNPNILNIEAVTPQSEVQQTTQSEAQQKKDTPKTETKESTPVKPQNQTYSKKSNYGNGKYYGSGKTYSKKTSTYTKKSYKQYSKKSGSK